MDEDDRKKWFTQRDKPPPPTGGFVRWNQADAERTETSVDELLSMQ